MSRTRIEIAGWSKTRQGVTASETREAWADNNEWEFLSANDLLKLLAIAVVVGIVGLVVLVIVLKKTAKFVVDVRREIKDKPEFPDARVHQDCTSASTGTSRMRSRLRGLIRSGPSGSSKASRSAPRLIRDHLVGTHPGCRARRSTKQGGSPGNESAGSPCVCAPSQGCGPPIPGGEIPRERAHCHWCRQNEPRTQRDLGTNPRRWDYAIDCGYR